MIDYLEILEKDGTKEMHDLCQALNTVNYQIAELQTIKEKLEQKLFAEFDHPEEGQKTYNVGKFDVTIKTGWIYSIDKEEYAANRGFIKPCFDPVKIKTTYEVDKKMLKDVEKYGSKDDLNLIATFISQKPSKLYLRVSSAD